MVSKSYRVAIWANRGTDLVHDVEFSDKTAAFRSFQRHAAARILERNTCVDLSRVRPDGSGTVLAVKYTDSDRVEIHPAFYGK